MWLKENNLKKRYIVLFKITALILMALTMILVKNSRDKNKITDGKPLTPVEIPVEAPKEQADENPEVAPKEIPTENPVEKPLPEKGPKELVKININDLLSIEFTSENRNLYIKKTNTKWSVNSDEYNRIDQKKVESAINSLLIFNSEETVSFSTSDSGKWGFGESSNTIEIKTTKNLFTIVLGSLNEDKTGYYMQIQGTDEVYLIKNSTGESLLLKLDDLRDRNLVLFHSDQIETLLIKNEKEIRIIPYKRSDMFTADKFTYMLEAPYNAYIPVSQKGFNAFLNSMDKTIQIVDFIDDGTPEKYGINDKSRSLTIKETDGKSNTLIIGSDAGSSKVYGKLNGAKQIFTVNRLDLPFLALKPFDLVDKLPHLISMETIDTFMITNENLAVIGAVERRGDRDTYSVNGFEIEEPTFINLYGEIQNLSLTGEAEKPIITEIPEFIISYKLYDGGSYWTHLNFYPYDSDHFAVSRNEEDPLFTIEKIQLQNMLVNVTATVDKIMGF